MEKPSEPDVVRIVRAGTARERPQEFDVKKYLRLVYKRRYAFVAAMMLVTGIIVAVGFLLPNKYEATSMVLIEGSYTNDVMKNVAVPASIDDRVKAVEIIMQSRPQVLKVLKELGYDLSRYTEGEVEQLVGSFQQATKIAINVNMSRRDVDMFMVSLRHTNPFIARDYVNALIRLYIEESQSSKRNEAVGARKFLMEQVDILKQRIGFIDAQIVSLRQQGESGPAIVKRLREESPRERLVVLRKRLHELLYQYTPRHPEVGKVQEEIADLERQETERLQKRGVDSDYDNLTADSTARTARTGRAASPTTAVREQKLKELERDRETYQKMYEEMLATLGKSEVSTRLEVQDKGMTFNVLEPAVLPLRPISPNRALIIMLGFFAGIGAALGFVIMMDSMDKSVKSVSAVKSFGLPVLAVFPYTRLPREAERVQIMNLLLFTVTLLYVAGFAVLLIVVSRG
jgi:uncharacterized protein involved in exopolysaccharide biosynthesis